MITTREQVKEYLRTKLNDAIERNGPYQLSSGGESDWYLDCRPVTFAFPRIVGKVVVDEVEAGEHLRPDYYAGVALAGVPMAVAAAQHAGPYVRSMAVRPEPKEHGKDGCVVAKQWNHSRPPRIVLCDDVFTTGGSLSRATQRLQEEWNCEPDMYVTLFNRNESMQGATNFCGIPLVSVFDLNDLAV